MADLTVPNINDITQPGDQLSMPMAVVKIPRGVAVFRTSATGYVTGTKAASGIRLAGIAMEDKDNTAGSAGGASIVVKRRGVAQFDTSGMAITDVGADVWLSDNHTVTKTNTSNCYAGKIASFISATLVLVDITAAVNPAFGITNV